MLELKTKKNIYGSSGCKSPTKYNRVSNTKKNNETLQIQKTISETESPERNKKLVKKVSFSERKYESKLYKRDKRQIFK